MNRKLISKRDIFILGVLGTLCLTLLVLWPMIYNQKGKTAAIYHGSVLVKTVDLTKGEEYTFSLDINPHVVFKVYADGSIAFIESDCPDQICVETGKISMVGQSAACLPNELMIRIEGESDTDIVVG